MNLRFLREQRRLSQERLAELSGLSLRTIQRLEAGHRVSYASLRALAATIEIPTWVVWLPSVRGQSRHRWLPALADRR